MLSLREFFRLASATLRAVFSLVAFAAVIWFGISWDELAVQAHNAPVGAPVLTLINAGGVILVIIVAYSGARKAISGTITSVRCAYS
jgi:hypothetical protein